MASKEKTTMSRERRNISQRKIRKISRKTEDLVIEKETNASKLNISGFSPNTKLYYSKVIFGASTGIITGVLYVFFPSVSTDFWFIFLIFGLSLCVVYVRRVLGILPEEIDAKRLWFSGTFTFVLLFIVLTSLIWMFPGPRF
jgi:hypothetical protein